VVQILTRFLPDTTEGGNKTTCIHTTKQHVYTQQNNMYINNKTTRIHTTKQHVYTQQNNTYTHNKTTRIHTTKQHARTQKITVPANIS